MQKHFLCLVALALLAGCSKDKNTPRTDFTGQVQLVDEFGNNQMAGSGVQVTTTDVVVPNGTQVTVQTGGDGTYSVGGAGNNNQQLTFAKSGYASCQSEVLTPTVSGSVSVPTVILGPVSSTVVTINQFQKTSTQVTITGTVSPVPTASQPRPHRFYMQKATAAGIIQPIALNYDFSVAGTTQPDGTFSDVIPMQDLQTVGFKPGDQIRVWGTGDNPKATVYRDVVYQRLVYPAAVPSPTNFKSLFLY